MNLLNTSFSKQILMKYVLIFFYWVLIVCYFGSNLTHALFYLPLFAFTFEPQGVILSTSFFNRTPYKTKGSETRPLAKYSIHNNFKEHLSFYTQKFAKKNYFCIFAGNLNFSINYLWFSSSC